MARGTAVARFHYTGEGNSDGERAEMTFQSLCDDTAAVIAHLRSAIGPGQLVLHGSRMGALVAGTLARSEGCPLSLWEPVSEPGKFFREAFRAKRLSNVVGDAERHFETWQEELAHNGVLDLLGYNAHPPLIESLEHLTLAEVLSDPSQHLFVAGFKDRPSKAQKDASSAGESVDSANFALAETWWFHNEQVHDASALVEATATWCSESAREGVGR